MSIFRHKRENKGKGYSVKGFTLIEIMISMAVSAAFIAMATLTYANFYKVYYLQMGYMGIHDDARKTIALVDRDVRKATAITNIGGFVYPSSASSTFYTNFLGLYIQPSSDGTRAAEYVIYRTTNVTVTGYSSPVGVIYRDSYTNLSTARVYTKQITRYPTDLQFSFFKSPGQSAMTSLSADTAEVRTYLLISNQVLKTVSTDRIQVRSKMRNKDAW